MPVLLVSCVRATDFAAAYGTPEKKRRQRLIVLRFLKWTNSRANRQRGTSTRCPGDVPSFDPTCIAVNRFPRCNLPA